MDIDTPRIRRLRQLLATSPRSGAGNRYPEDLRGEVAAAVHDARREGASMSSLAAALGLPMTTLSRWAPAVAPPGRLLRVDVVAAVVAAPVSTPVVELPSGLRIRGLSLEDIIALHRRLA